MMLKEWARSRVNITRYPFTFMIVIVPMRSYTLASSKASPPMRLMAT